MKKQIIICTMLALGLLPAGCGDFIEPKSKSEFVPKDANSLNELLLGEAYPRSSSSELNWFLHLLDDDVTGAPYQSQLIGSEPEIWWAPYTWQSDFYEIMSSHGIDANIYYVHYSYILGANAIMDYSDGIKDDLELLDRVIAQAYALRAHFYFSLVNIFGVPYHIDPDGPGVPLKLNSGMEESDLKRNTVKEVYNRIIADLLTAEKLYLGVPAAVQWQNDSRTSLPMVQLLLSRTYLYMEDWKNAAAYAKKVMDNRNFRLLDLNTVPTLDNSGDRSYLNYHSYANSLEAIWPYGGISDVTNYVSKRGGGNYTYFRASKGLMDSYAEGDLRKERYIIRSKTLEIDDGHGGMEFMPQAFGKLNTTKNYYLPASSSSSLTFGRSYRLSEAYLNYAEAKAMLAKAGDATAKTDALDAINKLRACRFAPEDYTAVDIADADALITFIREERRRELCFEDHRWFDLRRYGMPEIKHEWEPSSSTRLVYTLTKEDAGYTMPLPPGALDLNKALEQNTLAPAPRNGY